MTDDELIEKLGALAEEDRLHEEEKDLVLEAARAIQGKRRRRDLAREKVEALEAVTAALKHAVSNI